MNQEKPIGVVLFQLGGPDSLEAVQPFLYNLFSDPDIIDLPLAFLFRKQLARFISSKRAPKVQALYKEIGGKSPILAQTNDQATALELELRKAINAKVYVAMRYWHPMTSEVVERVHHDGIGHVILLPLYPQYSRTTTGSSVNEWNRVVAARNQAAVPTTPVRDYFDHPLYVKAIVQNIGATVEKVPQSDRSKIHLVFSAHGTPIKLVKEGDPYSHQIQKTYEAVIAEGRFGLKHHLCFQSKVGPQRWLEPSLDQTIERLAKENVSHVVVVPIAFVSEHIETLSEINIETREEAHELGIEYFDMMPALGTNPLFIQALADLVLKHVSVPSHDPRTVAEVI
jgi:ferrochelatase